MTTVNIDAARLELLLTELRLPGFKLMWPKLAEQSDKEGWPAARFLAALPSTNSPIGTAGALNAIWPRRVYRPERRSPPSTLRPCQWSQRLK